MINVLVVEDEKIPRDMVVKILLSQYPDKLSVRDASNGIKALSIASEFKPDLLITDISMPKMLGTDLAFKLHNQFPDCKIIFLTAYTDTDYLQSAIKLNAVDYLKKPLETDELKAAVEKALSAIDLLKKVSVDPLEVKLLGYIFKNAPIPEELTSLKILPELKSSYVSAAIISPCCEHSSDLFTLVSDAARRHRLGVVYRHSSRGQFEFLFYCRDKDITMRTSDTLSEFFEKIQPNEKFKCGVCAGKYGFAQTHSVYENAALAFEKAFFRPLNTIVYYSEQTKVTNNDFTDITSSIFNMATSDRFDMALDNARQLCKRLEESENLLISTAKKIYYDLYKEIYTFYQNYFSPIDDENMFSDLSGIFNSNCIAELHSYLSQLISNIEHTIQLDGSDRVVRNAQTYIMNNFHNPSLSLLDVVKFCNVNTNYLCSIFKKITGQTLNFYINQLRITEAKKLLLYSTKHINEISVLCGFNDSKYFSKVFTKFTGKTPSEFKKEYRGH